MNGKLAEEKIIAQFSSIAHGDTEKLKIMYSTLQMCTNKTSKCETFSWPQSEGCTVYSRNYF